MTKITYLSKFDGSQQPAYIAPASGREPRPLAVCLHTWSFGMEGQKEGFLARCRERNWHFIFPHFRGPNWTPEACGSEQVVSDIEGAVEYMRNNYAVDCSRIFLVGGSGGGHAALLMAGRRPGLWTAISAWCPISDIAAWYVQCRARKMSYADHIFAACGGDVVNCPEATEQARLRSPLTWLGRVADATVTNASAGPIIDIGTGIHDGHLCSSVPISHAILAFNRLAAPEDRISDEDITFMVDNESVPPHLRFDGEDPAYGPYKVLLRRVSGNVRLTLFEGGHDILLTSAFGFFDHQVRGNSPVWFSGIQPEVDPSVLSK